MIEFRDEMMGIVLEILFEDFTNYVNTSFDFEFSYITQKIVWTMFGTFYFEFQYYISILVDLR